MTDGKLLEVIGLYEQTVQDVLSDDEITSEHSLEALRHLLEMFPQMRMFVAEARREKLMRWLGWVQGVLYMCNIFTIEEMKRHNMPNENVWSNYGG